MAEPTATTLPPPSAFLHPPPTVGYSPTPSIIHLKRDLLLPVSFEPSAKPTTHTDGRTTVSSSNGILNTRFGDFAHSTIVGIPYGSQVRASNLGHSNRKRKRKDDAGEEAVSDHNSSGFLHVLAPTAETWTTSLPHRTQVVYTPDSSFILHKLGVRPGSVLIEAGAGSGSFTHAGVRAVYRGYPDGREGVGGEGDVEVEREMVKEGEGRAGRKGKVWSFEFHNERVEKLREEIERHGLDGLVEIVHRDVCKEGFLIKRKKARGDGEVKEGDDEQGEDEDMEYVSPEATAIFLDLPAPWLALPHLTRRTRPTPSLPTSTGLTPSPSPTPAGTDAISVLAETATIDGFPNLNAAAPLDTPLTSDPTSTSTAKLSFSTSHGALAPGSTPTTPDTLPSALSPTETIHICTFSPCIEQVTRTVSVLRKLGWVEIEMHEIQHRKIEVRRNNKKGYEDGVGPRSVDEAVQRLKWVGEYRNTKKEKDAMAAELRKKGEEVIEGEEESEQEWKIHGRTKGERQGSLYTRIEPEVKSHTSYLVFAVLPREWTDEEEEDVVKYVKATTKGVVNAPIVGEGEKWKWKAEKVQKISKRQMKKMEREQRKAAEEGRSEGGDKMDMDG